MFHTAPYKSYVNGLLIAAMFFDGAEVDVFFPNITKLIIIFYWEENGSKKLPISVWIPLISEAYSLCNC